MEAQSPAKGVSLQSEYDDGKFYQVHCECGSPEHTMDIMAELTQDDFAIEFHITAKVVSDRSYQVYTVIIDDGPVVSFFKGIANTVIVKSRMIWQILTKGYVETYSSIIMDEQHAKNFAAIIEKAAHDLNESKSNRKKKT